jgi:hypothetical protein
MAAWSFSAVEAGEPEERAAEEKDVVEKEAERKAERMGSEAMDSRADVAVVVGLLRVERSWRGEEDFWSGDAGDAISCLVFGLMRNAFGFLLLGHSHTGEGRSWDWFLPLLLLLSLFFFFFFFFFLLFALFNIFMGAVRGERIFIIKKCIGKLQCNPMHWVAL